MGHVRRMDPQPRSNSMLAEIIPTARERALSNGCRPLPRVWQTRNWDYADDALTFEQPADMPGAAPWQDRDGEWYWRMPPPNVPA